MMSIGNIFYTRTMLVKGKDWQYQKQLDQWCDLSVSLSLVRNIALVSQCGDVRNIVVQLRLTYLLP